MSLHDAIIFLSLAFSPLTIIACFTVCYVWRKAAIEAINNKPRRDLDWFIVGVFIGFLGSSIDNIYWGIAWTMAYIKSPYTDFWFNNGAWSNLPFRQITTTAAAYCHLQAALKTDDAIIRTVTISCLTVTSLYLFLLLLLK